MRFMVMHKVTPDTEAGKLPTPALIQGMGQLIGECAAGGHFLDGAGLLPSSKRLRLEYKAGQRTVTHGPYAGKNELPAGFAMVKVKDMDEALAWADRFAGVVGDVEIEVGPVTEDWDLGLGEKPADAPLRVLMMHKADAHSEAGAPPSPELMAKMGELVADLTRSGALLATEGLTPSSQATRLRYTRGQRTVTDGPFAESKELISGFCLMKFDSKAEVIAFCNRFAEVIGDIEVDIRPLFDGA